MSRVTVTLSPEEKDALHKLAEIECRDSRGQAALIIRQRLEQLGLLPKYKAPYPVDVEEDGST